MNPVALAAEGDHISSAVTSPLLSVQEEENGETLHPRHQHGKDSGSSPFKSPSYSFSPMSAGSGPSRRKKHSFESSLKSPAETVIEEEEEEAVDGRSKGLGIVLESINVESHSDLGVTTGEEKDVTTEAPPSTSITTPSLSFDSFILKKTLGTGSFGRVHLAVHKPSQRYVALKVLRKADVVKLKQVEHTMDERRILGKLDCPFLVHLLGAFQDCGHLYFAMEYIQGGELFSYLRRMEKFPNHVARFYAAEVTLAFEYLHHHGIVYRDLKPENLLIDSRGHIRIVDFGFAKQIRDVTWTLCGTPDYLAPEIIQSKGYGKAVDWWALGILIYEMIAGHPPFFDDEPFKLYEKILAGRFGFPPWMDPWAKDLVRRLLTSDLSKRLGNLQRGSADVKGHPWFSSINWDAMWNLDVTPPYVPAIRHEGDTTHFDDYDEDFEAYGREQPDLFMEHFRGF
ncbi:camp-dependent protein kinase catalytic subunit [Chytridiales sp. JEL 0842]|nr:camp-dependent protein kinase catalytic subunit [Chytridiales sp. JEL 0842]